MDECEDFDNYTKVLSEYEEAILNREELKNRLYEEIRIIKKLKV